MGAQLATRRELRQFVVTFGRFLSKDVLFHHDRKLKVICLADGQCAFYSLER